MTATPNGSIESRSKFDIAVITIVSEQTAAIRAALEGAQDFNEWVGPARRWFTSGTLPPLDDSAAGIRVIATQTMDQGNRSVISAYNELRRQGRTKLAVLVDIAGGIHRDVRLGDVVVADRVIYYDQRALTAEGTQRRGDTFRLPTEIASTVNRFFALNGEPTVLPATAAAAELMSRAEAACDQPSPPVFRIRKGPIASGEAVIKHRDDETRMWIHGFNDKTLAVETEAAGLAVAAHEEGRDNPSYGALVIRGISDHADQDKNDEWRTVAAAHAVLALRAMAPVIGQTLLSTRQANRPSS
jgi:adenosylhomocysteine nucleosidase